MIAPILHEFEILASENYQMLGICGKWGLHFGH